MSFRRLILLLASGLLLSLFLPPLYALEDKDTSRKTGTTAESPIVGIWEICQTKEPGKPYREGYKGLPFVTRGTNAFTLILEYRKDGTFRRTSRIGEKETTHDGTWLLSGSELRHRRNGSKDEEVMYVRFDNPNQYTSLEVFEATSDPGLFAQFKRRK